MLLVLGFLAGVVSTGAVAFVLARRRARRTAMAVAQAERAHATAARDAERSASERRASAVARIQSVVRDLRRRLQAAESAAEGAAAAAAAARAAAVEERVKAAIQADHDDARALEESDRAAAAAQDPLPVCQLEPESRTLAQALSHEVANIVSGIEGGTFRLIEAMPALRTRSDAVESLWLAIRRLRRFHDKMRAYVQVPEVEPGTTPVEPLLTGLRDELDATELGLQMAWSLPRSLPLLRGSIDELLGAFVFVSMALQQLERGALRLSIRLEPSFAESQPQARLELDLERDEALGQAMSPTVPPPAFLVARRAAQNLLRGLGGSLEIDHEPGHAARAVVCLPVVNADAQVRQTPPMQPATDVPLPTARGHRFGGALLIESDPAVRSMLASELKATGRAVFACADGAAARSLIQATPDRFEMLIVDHAARLDAGDMLTDTAEKLCPTLKVLVLSDFADQQLPKDLAARVTRIRKPFGVQELRRALAAAFAE